MTINKVTSEDMQNLYEHEGTEGLAKNLNYWTNQVDEHLKTITVLEEDLDHTEKQRDEARKLARMMYLTMTQFPTCIEDMVGQGWPEEEPEWLTS